MRLPDLSVLRPQAKLGLFGLGLLVLFTGSWGVGKLTGPVSRPATTGHETEHGSGPEAPSAQIPGGLQIAQDGYRLELTSPTLSTQDAAPLTFRVLGPDDKPVTEYTRSHEKDLHLVLVRRDLTGFQHVHPVLGADGVWSIPVKVNEPGSYRLFADFQPAALGRGLILGADLAAPGDFQPHPARNPSRTTNVGDYTVTLDGDLVPGASSKLTLTVDRAGVPVTDLQPYLGAFGHLVALRDGDLAYLHVHPDESTTAGPQIVFHAEVPSAGHYALFLDFKHDGIVHTAQFAAATPGHGH